MSEDRRDDLPSSTATATIVAAIDSATSLGSLAPLMGDASRQAVSSVRGTVYQAWQSIDAWLRLADDSTAIYLEGAEDFDVVRKDGAIAVQVRNTAQSISLNTRKALKALEAFWNLTCNEPQRRVELHYLTTSSIAHESDADFSGLSGIEAWRIAQTDSEIARAIASYLADKLAAVSPLRSFLSGNAPEAVQERLIRRFHWFVSQPDLEAVKRSVEDRIVLLLATQKRPFSLVAPIRRALESHFWEAVIRPEATDRQLTRAELLRQIAESTHTYLPIPLEQLLALMSSIYPGLGLLRLLLQKVPAPPSPLLDRPALTERLKNAIQQRKAVLITGTVNKGKTTLAQLAAAALCPSAWWLNVSGRQLGDLDTLLLALAQYLDDGTAPNLVILDDLDISESAYRVYQSSLTLVLHRARSSGRGVLLTAQGGTSRSSVVRDLENVELLEVNSLDAQELKGQCTAFGCPSNLADVWATFVLASTGGGHPKLVQVRLEELRKQGWQVRQSHALLGPSPAVLTERQITRRLLSETLDPAAAELVYTISESSIPLRRSIAVSIAESLPNLRNAGDVLDGLAGKWLERVERDELRATALIYGVASEIWSPEKWRAVHALLHDALRTKSPLTPSEAAATVFHAYMAQDPARLAMAALGLHLLDNPEAANQVNRNLLWLSWVALEPDQRIAEQPHTAAILRSLQFRVAATLESDALTRICQRWAEDIERIEHDELKLVSRGLRWLSIGISTQPLALHLRLEAIAGAGDLPPELRKKTHLPEEIAGPLTGEVSVVQSMFACATRSVRTQATLDEFVRWLDQRADDSIRSEFESVLEWPVVQALGAFVQGAWTAQHEETSDWEPWLALFERVEEYARRHHSPRFGREAAKARAIVLTEYLTRVPEAIQVLDSAIEEFGDSPILQEQRANTLFHAKDDAGVLDVWERLLQSDSNTITLDAFAYRRAAISAARMQRWSQAEYLFTAGSNAVEVASTEPTRFGLRADAALMRALSGNYSAAARALVEALEVLPEKAGSEGELRWEAALRVVSEISRFIESRAIDGRGDKGRTDPGWASSPNLKMPKAEPGQPARALLLQAEVRRMAACTCVNGPNSSTQLAALVKSPYLGVRWVAGEGQLALALDVGAGPDFLDSLLTFERVVLNEGISQIRQVGVLGLAPTGDSTIRPLRPERLSSLLIAGLVCASDHLEGTISTWEQNSARILGATAPLSLMIRSLLEGIRQPQEQLESVVRKYPDDHVRMGAAARLLTDPPSAKLALQLQLFLISGIANEVGVQFQKVWNMHVANRFARTWGELAKSTFQFVAPRSTVPELKKAIEALETGSGSLGKLIAAAQAAVGGRAAPLMSEIR